MAADDDELDEDGAAEGPAGQLRIDRWLWCARFYKTRSLAAQAVAGGRVHLNGARVKPSRGLRPGDVLTLGLEGRDVELTVSAIPARRGPASEARSLYAETPASLARGETWRAARRLASMMVPRPEGRPDKKERRALLDLARRQGRD